MALPLSEISSFHFRALKTVSTFVTTCDGSRFLENKNGITPISSAKGLGFVEDTNPDDKLHQVLPHLFIGSQDAALNEKSLKSLGITHVLTVAPINIAVPLKNCCHLTVPILDTPEHSLHDHLPACLHFMEEARLSEGAVLVHCNAGVSRSSSVVVAYLMTKECLSYSDALQLVKASRPCVCPNRGFAEQLRNLECFWRDFPFSYAVD
eukprot:GCRY01000613.1.p1 GENE.GCRY01000613.1~~GCRY01000613.1.p1  ORF type:complete len:208 (+),score=9.23 GCRY01000613.1:238-861(+)